MNILASDLSHLVHEVKALAIKYYRTTGRPLGATGELGEIAVVELMGLELCEARQEGFDAIKSDGTRVQIKTRALENPKKIGGQRVGAINIKKPWDTTMLVLMSNSDYEPFEIYEADRSAIENAINRVPTAGSAMRTEGRARKKGALAVSEFKRISNKVWPTS